MASTSYLPVKDAALAQWLTNFVTVANTNLSTLKLTPNDLATIQTWTQQFSSDMTNVATAKQAAATAFHSKKRSRTQGDAAARSGQAYSRNAGCADFSYSAAWHDTARAPAQSGAADYSADIAGDCAAHNADIADVGHQRQRAGNAVRGGAQVRRNRRMDGYQHADRRAYV